MHPLYLQVRGMRPWKSHSRTDIILLGDRPIVMGGEGRADEPSIRRAVAYALYGQTPCGDRGLRTLMDDESRHMRVRLVFRAHGNTWEVARRVTRRPDGVVVTRSCILWRFGEAKIVRGVRRVNRRLAELLEHEGNGAQHRPRSATGCLAPSRSRHGGDADGEAAATSDDIAWLCECMAAFDRAATAERNAAANLGEATAAAAEAAARHRQTQATLAEHVAALRKTRARKATALERLWNALMRCKLWWR